MPESPSATHPNLLQLWHLLSLDAPTVAAVWVLFVAHAAGVALPWTAPLAMFVAVWMLYAADRLLDARSLADGRFSPELEARHRFHFRHRRAFFAGIMAASVLLSILLHLLNPRSLHLYAVLAALLASWLLLIHARAAPSAAAHRLPKELAVGVFFPAAIFIPTVARAPWLQAALLPPALLFSAVCTLNCLFLYAWEHPGERPLAHWTTRWAANRLPGLGTLAIVLSLAFAALNSHMPRFAAPFGRSMAETVLALTCACSAGLLLLLHGLRRRLSPLTLRACADLVLLTPLLGMPLLHLLGR